MKKIYGLIFIGLGFLHSDLNKASDIPVSSDSVKSLSQQKRKALLLMLKQEADKKSSALIKKLKEQEELLEKWTEDWLIALVQKYEDQENMPKPVKSEVLKVEGE